MWIIVLLVLLTECFWGLKIADYNVVALVFSIPFIYYYIEYRQRRKFFSNKADIFISLVWLFIIINIISCWIFRDQSPYLTLRTSDVRNFVPLFFFYYLLKKKYSVIDVEKSIEVLLFSFAICYLLQFFVFYPNEVFALLGGSVGGDKRFRFVGQLILFIGYFYFLNNILLEKDSYYKNILGLLLSFICIVLLGFRSYFASILLVSLIQIYRVKGVSLKSFKTIICGVLCLFLLSQTEMVQNVIENMKNRQHSQTFSNKEYIRWMEFNYYTNNHFQNGYEMFWGSGPWNGDSQYGKYIESFRRAESVISGNDTSVTTWWDWGLIGLSWAMGIPLALLIYIYLFYMAFKKTNKRYYYMSSIYIFLILTSITTIETYRFGAFTFHALLLYLMYAIRREKIRKNLISK